MLDLSEIRPLPAPVRGFPVSEFETRLASAQQLMGQFGFDLLMLTSESEIYWFTGFLTQFWRSPTRPWFLVVPQTGQPVAVIPAIGADCMARTWIDDIRTWNAPDPYDDGVSLLAAALRELGGHRPAIGIAQGRETQLRAPLRDFLRLGRQVDARWRDASPLLSGLRAIKSEREIVKIEHAALIASQAFEILPEIIRSGMSEIDVFRAFKMLALALGCDDPDYLAGGSGPGGYSDIISPPSRRALLSGDVLVLDAGLVWDGYYCDFDRNFAIGEPASAAADAYRVAWEGTAAGIEAAKPGATCAEVFRAMNSVLAPHAAASHNDIGRLGHGLGTQLTEFPSFAAWDETELEPGMVMTLEPSFTFAPSRVMVHEENVVIRDSGAQLLTKRAPQSMPKIG
jgi:Xaa-Pro dipeptidase